MLALATGLQMAIADLSSRYVLGFSLDDRDDGDGRMRRFEVTVEAPEARGQKRRFQVRARTSHYLLEGRVSPSQSDSVLCHRSRICRI